LFDWLVRQPAVLFSDIKSALAPDKFFSHNKSTLATSQPNKLLVLHDLHTFGSARFRPCLFPLLN
jgi:hypothetical protein